MKAFYQLLLLGVLTLYTARVQADTYSIIHNFGILTNATGFNPIAPLTEGPDGTLYGATTMGEGTMGPTVFRVDSNGTGFQVLKFFTNNADGYELNGGLLLVGNMLYGTSSLGGTNATGNIYGLTTDGRLFTNLYQFGPSGGFLGNGAEGPNGSLIFSGGLLYGTTQTGGASDGGILFQISTNGTGMTAIADFGPTNGAEPQGIVLARGTIYGVTSQGPTTNYGTIFKVNTDMTGFTNLHTFLGPEGAGPACQLLLAGSTLYGTTEGGSSNYTGIIFSINTDGSGYTNFYNFTSAPFDPLMHQTNFDGAVPEGGLVLVGNTLYGTTSQGGTNGYGTIFAVNTSGGGFSTLESLPLGDAIYSGMIRSNATLYGAVYGGGTHPYGCLFTVDTGNSSVSNFYTFHGSDGAGPENLLLSSDILYGVAGGGYNSGGMIYRLNVNGSAYSDLYDFNSGTSAFLNPQLSTGAHPNPILVGNALYDFAGAYPSNDTAGVCLFRINTDGSGYTNLWYYVNSPTLTDRTVLAGPTYYNGTLFGANAEAGSIFSPVGTLFALSTNGQNFTNFLTIPRSQGNGPDGPYPDVPLLITNNVIYGVAGGGGTNGVGMIFSVNTDGSNFKDIYTFSALSFENTNTDGCSPNGPLLLWGNTLYGTAQNGGFYASGTIYRVDIGGTNFQNLHNFSGYSPDGEGPDGALILSGSTLYGTISAGIEGFGGSVFSIATNGNDFTILHAFQGPEGSYPMGALVQSGNALYGATLQGGTFNEGVIFTITPGVNLRATIAAGKLILTWPDPTYTLQSAPTLTGTFSAINGATSPYTNRIAGTQRYFRLVSN